MHSDGIGDKINLYDLTYKALVALLSTWGYSEYHARRVWDHLYPNLTTELEQISDLRPDLRQQLISCAYLTSVRCVAESHSQDLQTVKYLLQLADGETVETVLMRYPGRAVACISTQVGCAMGCVFCATGQMGFVRNLSAGEIVAQVMYVMRILRQQGEKLRNIVFMGMGEPLHNYEASITAVAILIDDRGLAIAPRHITLSTVGLPEAIRRLADDNVPVNLAVSLHAADDETRAALVPVGRRWSLQQIIAACQYYASKRARRIFFEWALIAGSNDGSEQAHQLGRLLHGMDAHVNLIPLNPTGPYDGRPSSPEAVRLFQTILAGYGLPSTIRQRRGLDINAGCGQLRASASQ
jgi:23S rRNA (adenine2503-C2)-methyltransferase